MNKSLFRRVFLPGIKFKTLPENESRRKSRLVKTKRKQLTKNLFKTKIEMFL